MEIQNFEGIFREIFVQNGLKRFRTAPIIEKFETFTVLLQQTNAHTNLTAIRDIPGIIAKHYADCLLAEPYFTQGASVLDVGCGGGFPTIPLGIVRQDLHLTAIDSTAKKIAFVNQAASELKLENVHPICARIEDAAMAKQKQSFDIGTSRAVARLRILVELVLPYIKIGGQLIALKGAAGEAELAEARDAIRALGGEVAEVKHKTLHIGTDSESRVLILVRKVRATPSQYPRQYALISKKPL